MGIYERKEREKNERRALILDMARRLILERGVDSVSMQELANACELSKGALYLYFDNKEALLAEIFHEAASAFIGYVHERIRPEDTGLQAIHRLWSSYLELFGQSSDIIVLFGVKNALAPEYPWKAEADSGDAIPETAAMLGLIADILAKGVADGSLDPAVVPDRVAHSIMMIAGGIVENIARLPVQMRNHTLILEEMKTTFEIVLRGIASRTCDPGLLNLSGE
jgi:AcrR family transcriptional regulator